MKTLDSVKSFALMESALVFSFGLLLLINSIQISNVRVYTAFLEDLKVLNQIVRC